MLDCARDSDGLSDPQYCVRTYPVEVRGKDVWVQLPATTEVACAPA